MGLGSRLIICGSLSQWCNRRGWVIWKSARRIRTTQAVKVGTKYSTTVLFSARTNLQKRSLLALGIWVTYGLETKNPNSWHFEWYIFGLIRFPALVLWKSKPILETVSWKVRLIKIFFKVKQLLYIFTTAFATNWLENWSNTKGEGLRSTELAQQLQARISTLPISYMNMWAWFSLIWYLNREPVTRGTK